MERAQVVGEGGSSVGRPKTGNEDSNGEKPRGVVYYDEWSILRLLVDPLEISPVRPKSRTPSDS